MTFIHIKKIQTGDPQSGMREVFAVPAVAIATPQGRKLIPNPSGNEATLFTTLEEAEEAVRTAGFDYIFEGKKTYTLGSQGAAAEALPASATPLEQAIPLLIKHLKDREPSVVANSAFALGELKAHSALESLSQILGHEDPTVRKHVAEAMGGMGYPALGFLREAFRAAQTSSANNAPYIRLTVMIALLEMTYGGNTALIDQFLPLATEALDDESWLVRAQAALVVGHAAKALEKAQEEQKALRDKHKRPL